MGDIGGRARTVVLANGVDGGRVAERLVVGRTCRGNDRARSGAPRVQHMVQEHVGAGADQPFRVIGRLGEQEEVVGSQAERPRQRLPHVQLREHVQYYEGTDRVRVVEREPVAYEGAALVSGHGEPVVAEAAHEG